MLRPATVTSVELVFRLPVNALGSRPGMRASNVPSTLSASKIESTFTLDAFTIPTTVGSVEVPASVPSACARPARVRPTSGLIRDRSATVTVYFRFDSPRPSASASAPAAVTSICGPCASSDVMSAWPLTRRATSRPLVMSTGPMNESWKSTVPEPSSASSVNG